MTKIKTTKKRLSLGQEVISMASPLGIYHPPTVPILSGRYSGMFADKLNAKVTHVKPHGALNNMACEDLNLSKILAETIYDIDKNLIYLVPTGSKMEEAARKVDMKIACEIFADRNYEDDGNLVSRNKPNAVITDPEKCKLHVLKMVETQSINCFSGKKKPNSNYCKYEKNR